jgi:hypothetical protein
MGKINIKLANNYIYNPQDAASDYSASNRTITIAVPENVKSLQIPDGPAVNLQEAFGCWGEMEDGRYWGLAVCYLKNQQAGFQEEWDKSQDLLESNGQITAGVRTIQQNSNKTDWSGAQITNQLFIDGAKKALANLNSLIINKQDDWEVDFNVQFDPSGTLGHDYKYTLGFSGPPGWPEGSTQPAGRHDKGDRTINSYLYTGAYGDVRAWMSGSNISFYNAQATTATSVASIEKFLDGATNECSDEQSSRIEDQWEQILNPPGGK